MEDAMWLAFFWTGPIGIGVFLAGLGLLLWLGAKAKEINRSLENTKKK